MEKSNIYIVLNENDMDDILVKNMDILIIVLYISKKEDNYINMRRQYIEISKVLQNDIFLFIDISEFKNTMGKYVKNIDIPIIEFYYNKAMIAYTAGFNKEMIIKSVFSLKTKLNELKQKLSNINKVMVDPKNQQCRIENNDKYIKMNNSNNFVNMQQPINNDVDVNNPTQQIIDLYVPIDDIQRNNGMDKIIGYQGSQNGICKDNNPMRQIIDLCVPNDNVRKNDVTKNIIGLHMPKKEIYTNGKNAMQQIYTSETIGIKIPNVSEMGNYSISQNNRTNIGNSDVELDHTHIPEKVCAIILDASMELQNENDVNKPIIKVTERTNKIQNDKNNKIVNNPKITEIDDEQINNDDKSELIDNLKKIYVLQQLQKIKEAEEI